MRAGMVRSVDPQNGDLGGLPGGTPERRTPLKGCGVRKSLNYLAADSSPTRWAIADLRLAAWFL